MNRALKKRNGEDWFRLGLYGGLIAKGIYGAIELFGGVLLLLTSHSSINKVIEFLTFHEIKEDPKDLVMNLFIRLGENLSISSQHAVGISPSCYRVWAFRSL